MKPIEELEAERLDWSLKTFTEADAKSSLAKLRSEIFEIEEELDNTKQTGKKTNLTMEYADALMCLFDSAGRADIKPRAIFEAFEIKLAINKERKWHKNRDNSYSHDKSPEANCDHRYSKAMNQVYPRLCIDCKQPETF